MAKDVEENAEGGVAEDGLVECSATRGDRTVTVYLDLGTNIEEAKGNFGEDVVFDMYVRSCKIKAQSQIRSAIDAGADDDAIVADFSGWNPGETRTSVRDPKTEVQRNLAKMSDDEKAEFFAQLQRELGL